MKTRMLQMMATTESGAAAQGRTTAESEAAIAAVEQSNNNNSISCGNNSNRRSSNNNNSSSSRFCCCCCCSNYVQNQEELHQHRSQHIYNLQGQSTAFEKSLKLFLRSRFDFLRLDPERHAPLPRSRSGVVLGH